MVVILTPIVLMVVGILGLRLNLIGVTKVLTRLLTIKPLQVFGRRCCTFPRIFEQIQDDLRLTCKYEYTLFEIRSLKLTANANTLNKLVLGSWKTRLSFWVSAYFQGAILVSTLPKTNIAPENRPLEKEIPIGNDHF